MSTRRLNLFAVGIAVAVSALAGCNSAPPPAVPAPQPAAPEPPQPGVIGALVGRELDEKDRETAIAAQQEAVSSGARKSWKGGHGAYGFITPGPETGGCRDYTHRVFINGRPQEAKGRACRKDDGWRVTS